MHNYCTIFSRESLYRGLLFYYSLQKQESNFRLFIIFIQDEVRELVARMGLKNVVLIGLSDIENEDPELRLARSTRDNKEYAWTLKAPMILYIFNHYSDCQSIFYIDADTEFYSSPDPMFEELNRGSVLLTRERFYIQDNEEWYEKYGRFNGGVMGFKRDEFGLIALRWLRERCLSWCFNRVENGLYGDQKFIDEMERSHEGVVVANNMGINATAWYSHASVMEFEGGRLLINRFPLVLYHYSGFIQYSRDDFELCIYINLPGWLVNSVYLPYIRRIRAIIKYVEQYDLGFYEEAMAKNESGYYKNRYTVHGEEQLLPERIKSNDTGILMDRGEDKVINFCTIIGRNYIIKGLALYQSLRKRAEKYHLYICCLDSTVSTVLGSMNLENTTLIPLEWIEDNDLLRVKGSRTESEYCWTLKSSWMLYLIRRFNTIRSLIYVDADIFFFSSPEAILKEMEGASVMLCPQREKPENEAQFGRYQGGLIGVNRSSDGIRFLEWWRERCIEWCSSEQGHSDKWGDQKYLDRVPELFQSVLISQNRGVDAAIWNVKGNMSLENSEVYVGGYRLVAYHFCCLEIFNEEDYDLWFWPNWSIDEVISEHIYLPYIKALRSAMEKIRESGFNVISLWADNSRKDKAVNYYRYVHRE